jgi:bacteriorhodopsin
MPVVHKLMPKKINKSIYISFFLSFLALSGSTIFTLLGSLATYNKEQRYLKNALISETAVNIIAGLTYFYFLKYLYEFSVPLEDFTSLRYLDWIITTPFLLLSFALYAYYEKNKNREPGSDFQDVDFTPLSYIIVLDVLMLIFGWLGENKLMNENYAFILSFTCFALLFYFIWESYVKDNNDKIRDIYIVFVVIWSLYGFSYYLPVVYKNISYNILDMIAKSAFGIFLWITTVQDLDN